MKILPRYIAKEIMLPFAFSLLTLNFIFMAGYLVRVANLIIGRGIPLADTLYVLILAMPEMISYTVPMSILTAVMIVFGSLSQGNEIRAIKASGIHPVHVITPALLIGLVLSFFMFVFNDQITTNAAFELRRTTKKMLLKHPEAAIEAGRFVQLSDTIKFRAKELHGKKMKDIVAFEVEAEDKPIRMISAERGEVVSNQDHSEMQIRLYDGSVSDSENSSVQSIQFQTYEFPTLGQEDVRKLQKKKRELSLAELVMFSSQPDLSKEDLRQVWTAFHERIAFAFGSFIFVFIGVPIAILVQRGEIVLSFGITMIAACIYYILFAGARTLSMSEVVPPYVAFWIPNFILLSLGAYLYRKSVIS